MRMRLAGLVPSLAFIAILPLRASFAGDWISTELEKATLQPGCGPDSADLILTLESKSRAYHVASSSPLYTAARSVGVKAVTRDLSVQIYALAGSPTVTRSIRFDGDSCRTIPGVEVLGISLDRKSAPGAVFGSRTPRAQYLQKEGGLLMIPGATGPWELVDPAGHLVARSSPDSRGRQTLSVQKLPKGVFVARAFGFRSTFVNF